MTNKDFYERSKNFCGDTDMSYKRSTKYNEHTHNAEVYACSIGKDIYYDGVDIVNNESSIIAQETIDKLAELEDKIENGTLIKLPYTMGDKIFGVKQVFDDEGRIVWFLFEDTIRDISYHIQGPFNLKTIQINHIDSKYVFKTKEQAKAKLKEMQGKE